MNSSKISLVVITLSFLLLTDILNPEYSISQIKNDKKLTKMLTISKQEKTLSDSSEKPTLELYIKKAVANNPGIKYKSFKIKEANAQRNKSASQKWPTLRGIGSYTRYSDTQRMAPPRRLDYPLIFADNVLSWNLLISMPLFTGGRIRNEIQAMELLQQSSEYGFVYTRQELVFNVTSVYYSIIKQRKIIESLDFSKTTLEKHLTRIEQLIQAKKAASLDKLRLEVRLATIDQKTEQEKNVLAIQHRYLANLMGIKEIDFSISQQGELKVTELEIDLNECINNAYTKRADYLAVQKKVGAQAKRLKATYATFWPSISIYGSYGAKKAIGSYIKPPGVNGLEDIGQLGFLLEIPFFEGGKIRANVQEHKAKLAMLQERQRELELKIRLEVESAVYNLTSTKKRILVTEKAIEQADESLRIEIEKYNLGKGSITDILDAESALLEVQTSYNSAVADYHIFIAQLQFVQGEDRATN